MNKGKDFWAPRRHGFDDDGPMPYEQRQRASRPYGTPDNSFEESSASGVPQPLAGQPTVDATVKWFKEDKGFGFVELADGQGDAFLHATALHSAGHDTVAPGAKMRVVVSAGAKGPQVARVISIDSSGAVERPRRPDGLRPPRRAAPDPSTATSLEGRVKWFNQAKGFGFVAVEDGGKDIFVHISALNAAGISHLDEGQPVNMRVVDTPRGREAISITL
jgi:CspA family cold shock protein